MTNERPKLANFRQLSLRSGSPDISKKRSILRKQISEELPCDIGIKINIKNKQNTCDIDRPIKIAWDTPVEDSVIGKKCPETKKKSQKQENLLEKESILNSKTVFPNNNIEKKPNKEKHDSPPERNNLNIFLAHKFANDHEYTSDNEESNPGHKLSTSSNEPKMMEPLLAPTNLFQIRKPKKGTLLNSPHELDTPKTIVVTPMIEHSTNTSSIISNKSKPIDNVIIRPATASAESASAKRSMFKNRANSAFNCSAMEPVVAPIVPPAVGRGTRPPLIRSSSAPSKPEKPKFVASKRRLKSAKKRDKLSHFSPKNEEDCQDSERTKSRKELNRSILLMNGSEIETMVSLVSPSCSDTEDVEEPKPKEIKSRNNSPTKNIKNEAVVGNRSLRKIVKSVSFQQSTIHAIRSFSASFPARRSSMVSTLLLGNTNIHNLPTSGGGTLKRSTSASVKMHEKRTTNLTVSDTEDEFVPKRPSLIRACSVDCPPKSYETTKTGQNKKPQNTPQSPKKPPIITITPDSNFTKIENSPIVENFSKTGDQTSLHQEKDDEESNISDNVKFQNPKEKQCWEMYCKMTDKGIKVTYETILRGMLTPTEYRLRRHSFSVVPSLDE